MNSKTPVPKPIDDPDAEAVERQYGELGSVYAATRSAVAKSLDRKEAAREWREVEAEIEKEDGGTLER